MSPGNSSPFGPWIGPVLVLGPQREVLVDEAQLTYLHVFPFSPRKGTPAARMPQLDRRTVKERAMRLRTKGAAKADKRAGREASEGWIGSYVHHDGSVAVLVELNSETDFVARTDDFKALAKEIAVHIAATKPLAVRIEDLPADLVQRERQVYESQVAEQKKPENIRAKIVDGMLKRFYEDNVLLEQKFVKDDKRTVGELVKELSGKTGEKVEVRRFARFELGGN